MSVVEVQIGSGSGHEKFRVEARSRAAGEASCEVSLQVDRLSAERANFQQTLLLSSLTARQVLTSDERSIRRTGEALFGALLGSGEVAGLYRASAALADDHGEELRIVLRLDAPELAALPWEAMYDPVLGVYICRQHQLVRYVSVAEVTAPLTVRLPLRVLGVISDPRGLPRLNSAREREHLTRALAPLSDRGLAELAWASDATWDGLHQMLLSGPWHVLHFVGHGDFDVIRDEGTIALVRDDGGVNLVEASRFASLLRQARPMPRLVVLNSCSGGVVSKGDLFSGTASALARSGVGAVTAMQYAISDAAAVAFARGFYASLAHGRGVDEALSAGRIGILGTGGQTLEWITPIMYLRGHETRLFSLPTATKQSATPKRSPELNPISSATSIPSRPDRILIAHTDSITGVSFSPDGLLLATSSGDTTVRVWDVKSRTTVRTLIGHTDYVADVAFSPDGTFVATASADKAIRLWKSATGRMSRALNVGADVTSVAFSPDGFYLAAGSDDATIRLWRVSNGQSARTLVGHASRVTSVSFSPNGTLVASASMENSALIWDVATNRIVNTLIGHAQGISQVTFSPDGTQIATASLDQTARIWDAVTGQVLHILNGHSSYLHGIAFSPDGALVATASDDKTVRLWEAATGATVQVLGGHTDRVNGVAFSPDGTILATISRDKTARLWV